MCASSIGTAKHASSHAAVSTSPTAPERVEAMIRDRVASAIAVLAAAPIAAEARTALIELATRATQRRA